MGGAYPLAPDFSDDPDDENHVGSLFFRFRDLIREAGYSGDIWFGVEIHQNEPSILVNINGTDHFMPNDLQKSEQDAWLKRLFVN